MNESCKIFFTILTCCVFLRLNASLDDSTAFKQDVKRKACFLVHMNTTLNAINTRVPIQNSYERQRPWIGFDAGITFDYSLHKNVSLGTGLFHSIKSLRGYPVYNADSTFLANEFVVRRFYIEVPVYVMFYFSRTKVSPYFTLGLVNQIMYKASYAQFDSDLKFTVPMNLLEADKNRLNNLSLLLALGFRRELRKGLTMGMELPVRISLLQAEPRNSIYSVGLNFVMGYSF